MYKYLLLSHLQGFIDWIFQCHFNLLEFNLLAKNILKQKEKKVAFNISPPPRTRYNIATLQLNNPIHGVQRCLKRGSGSQQQQLLNVAFWQDPPGNQREQQQCFLLLCNNTQRFAAKKILKTVIQQLWELAIVSEHMQLLCVCACVALKITNFLSHTFPTCKTMGIVNEGDQHQKCIQV